MTQLNLQQERFGLIQFIWKNKKPIFIITGFAAIISIIGFISDYTHVLIICNRFPCRIR